MLLAILYKTGFALLCYFAEGVVVVFHLDIRAVQVAVSFRLEWDSVVSVELHLRAQEAPARPYWARLHAPIVFHFLHNYLYK